MKPGSVQTIDRISAVEVIECHQFSDYVLLGKDRKPLAQELINVRFP